MVVLFTRERSSVLRGKQWFGPESDPLSTGKSTDPEAWCLDHLWIFAWMPFDMYRDHVDLKAMECIHCGERSINYPTILRTRNGSAKEQKRCKAAEGREKKKAKQKTD